MTGPRIAAVNRRDARLSTGPRTASGKQRAARNSWRYGLSLPVLADPALAEDIRELAERLAKERLADQRLASDVTEPEMRELAVAIAAAQVDVQRVRHARNLLTTPQPMAAPATKARPGRPRAKSRQLVALDRYERQAMWRRTWAIRAWQTALLRGIGGAPIGGAQ